VAADVLMVAVGVAVIVWSRWLLPRQLWRIHERTHGHVIKYDDAMVGRIASSWLVRATVAMGCVLVTVGVALAATG